MAFIWRKLLQLVIVLLCVTFFSFFMLTLLPGNLADTLCGIGCTQEQRDQKVEELRLNDPVYIRYADWLGNVARGDFGRSGRTQQDISEALTERIPVTAELVIYSQLLALGIAIPIAVVAARRAGGVFDRVSTTTAFGFLAAPPFVVAPVLVLIFAVNLKWFPATGYTPFLENPLDNLRTFFLPALTLALAEMAVYMRLLRTDLISTLQEDYITMAKAKGIPPKRILWKHAFRPSTFSLVTVAGLNMGRLSGGAFVVEVIFSLNGLGKYIVDGILGRDYLAVQAGVVVVAFAYVLINFGVDLLYAVLDPRIRHARALA